MIYLECSVLVSLKVVFILNIIQGSRTISLDPTPRQHSGKSHRSSAQQDFLNFSPKYYSRLQFPLGNGTTIDTPSVTLIQETHIKEGVFPIHHNNNVTITHLFDNMDIPINRIRDVSTSVDDTNASQGPARGHQPSSSRRSVDDTNASQGPARRHQPSSSWRSVDDTNASQGPARGHQPSSSGRHQRATLDVPERLLLTTPELIRKHNYPVEEHFAVTPDGYILGLHRIPGPHLSPAGSRANLGVRRVVLLMHGLFSTSSSFLVNGPKYSLGFLLADAGYDVWLGNCRGNTYSRNHTSLNPDKQIQFWHYSQDEMASQDIPTMVRYALKQSGAHGLFYVGYSQGAGLLYRAASAKNTIIDKVHLFIAMANIGQRELDSERKAFNDVVNALWRVLETVGVGELQRRKASQSTLFYWLCNADSFLSLLCAYLVQHYFSCDVPANPLIKPEMVPYVLTDIFNGGSLRQYVHLYQPSKSNKILKFNFGSSENRQLYGSADPPSYDISAVTCPTALYWASNDPITPENDVIRVAADLPNVVSNYKVLHPDFNHVDYLYSERAKDLVYNHVINLMYQY